MPKNISQSDFFKGGSFGASNKTISQKDFFKGGGLKKEKFSIGRTLANIPSSGARLIGDIGSAVFNPIDTFKSLAQAGAGGLQLLVPGEQGREEQARQIGRFFKDRYGSKEAALRTLQEDPVGVAADLAGLITGAGATLRGVGVASKISKVSAVGRGVQELGAVAEPINLISRGLNIAAKPALKVIKTLGTEALGITTGAGGNVIKTGFRAASTSSSAEFKAALRGTTSSKNILTSAREGLNRLKDKRRTSYLSQSGKIDFTQKVNFSPIKDFIDKKLGEFNIVRKGNKLNFKQSKIADSVEQKRISEVVKNARTWKNTTVGGIDILLSQLSDFFTPSKKGTALTTSIQAKVRNSLNKVKGYNKLTGDYRKSSLLIEEIEKTLSLKNGVTTDTALRKLITSLKQDVGFREELLKVLDEATGKDVRAQLAGASLSPIVPSGLIGRGLVAGAAPAVAVGAAAGIINPSVLIGILGASPRLIGEFMLALGIGAKGGRALAEQAAKIPAREITQGAFQAGRIDRTLQP